MSGQLVRICVYNCLTVSLNLLIDVCGELSLGHASFMGVGVYAGVIAASLFKGLLPDPTIRLIVSLLCGGVAAGAVGFLVGIPALRLRGDYLAIVTLAFGEILRNILQNLYVGNADGVVRFAFSDQPPQWKANIVNGAVGTRIPMDNKIATFLMSFILVLFTLFVVFNIINSKEGRAIKAVRDNRIAAESVGINVTAFRMKAFVVSAVLAGMAGALFGLNYSSITASKFNFNTSINILVFVVMGGMGNIMGSVISATVLYVLPEAMRGLQDYRMILYAVVLILVMLFTWSPKFKDMVAVLKAKLFGNKEKKEVGTK
jgi:branched-chain amino acid transport system permease protein